MENLKNKFLSDHANENFHRETNEKIGKNTNETTDESKGQEEMPIDDNDFKEETKVSSLENIINNSGLQHIYNTNDTSPDESKGQDDPNDDSQLEV